MRWLELPPGAEGDGSAAVAAGGAKTGAAERADAADPRARAYPRARAAEAETIAKAPAWLFSAESDLAPPAVPYFQLGGVRVDARGWGSSPAPWVLAHFVCSAWPGSEGREQAMRAWGHWRPRAISRELPTYARRQSALRVGMVGLARPVRVETMAEAAV